MWFSGHAFQAQGLAENHWETQSEFKASLKYKVNNNTGHKDRAGGHKRTLNVSVGSEYPIFIKNNKDCSLYL